MPEDERSKQALHNYILKKYKNGIFMKQYREYRRLNDKPEKNKWIWATTIGFADGTRKLETDDEEVRTLTEEYNSKIKTLSNIKKSNEKKTKKLKKLKKKDTRSLRNAKGQFGRWVPPQKRTYYRDEKGKFISEIEYERILRLTINKQRTQTPERRKEINDIEYLLTQPTNRKEQNDNMLLKNLTEARRNKDLIQTKIDNKIKKLQTIKQQQSNAAGSSNSIDNEISKIEKSIKKLKNQLEDAKAKEIESQNNLFVRNRQSDLPVLDSSDDNYDDDNYDDGNFNDDNFDNSETTITTTTTSRVTQDSSIVDNTLPMFKTWTPTVVIKGILRRPIKLKTILKWIQSWTEKRFCDGVKRLMYNVKPRPNSWYTNFKEVVDAKALQNVQNEPYKYSLPSQIIWAWKQVVVNADSRLFKNVAQIKFNEHSKELLPVLLSYSNKDLFKFEFNNIIRPLIGQSSAITLDYVLLVTSSTERQMVLNNQGETDSYWNSEIYKIPLRKLVECAFYMLAYRRKKARIISIYDPHPIIAAVVELISNEFRKGLELRTVVYKPWFNYEKDTTKTLINKPKTVLKNYWFKYVWNLQNIDDNNGYNGFNELEAYQRKNDRARWRVTTLGNKNDERRIIYDNGIKELDRLYEEFIRNWGGTGTGKEVLDQITEIFPTGTIDDENQQIEANEEVPIFANPLIQLEQIDEVFTYSNLIKLVQTFVDNMKVEYKDVALPENEIVGRMLTAFSTQKLRGVKRGIVIESNVDENKYTIQWDLPAGVFDALNVTNPIQSYKKEEILKNHRLVAAFLLEKIGRKLSPFMYSNDTTLVQHLRSGNIIEWDRNRLHDMLHRSVKEDYVIFEIDLSNIDAYSELEDFFKDFVNIIQLMNTEDRPCSGRYKDPNYDKNNNWKGNSTLSEALRPEQKFTVSKEMKKLLEDFEDFFEANNLTVNECANKFCNVKHRSQLD